MRAVVAPHGRDPPRAQPSRVGSSRTFRNARLDAPRVYDWPRVPPRAGGIAAASGSPKPIPQLRDRDSNPKLDIQSVACCRLHHPGRGAFQNSRWPRRKPTGTRTARRAHATARRSSTSPPAGSRRLPRPTTCDTSRVAPPRRPTTATPARARAAPPLYPPAASPPGANSSVIACSRPGSSTSRTSLPASMTVLALGTKPPPARRTEMIRLPSGRSMSATR